MNPLHHSTTSSSSRSAGVAHSVQPQKLSAEVFVGQDGCEHQLFSQSVTIIHGTGRDAGTVTIQIDDACISFNSVEALIAMLDQRQAATAVLLAG